MHLIKHITILAILLIASSIIAQNKTMEAYRLYDNKGNQIEFKQMVNEMSQSDVILFGELHNNPIAHWFQSRLTKAVYAIDSSLVLGAEMFESDDQILINEYLSGMIRTKDFEKYANLWSNYSTDYKPLFEFAVENNLKFVATNIPRRYASMVSRGGFEVLDQLSPTAKSQIAPLPIPYDSTVTSYVEMMDMMMGHGTGRDNTNIIRSQASKDATMAHFVLTNIEKGVPFLHFQGDFHSGNYSGMYWYLKHYNPQINISTLSTISVEDLNYKKEYNTKADYILLVIDDMTTTY